MTETGRRVDASALKGLAHPLRVDILDSLVIAGPATASRLAARLGQSSGATSYHLRQLARHGFVEEDPDRGTARERWWRVVPGGVTLSPTDMEGDRAAEEAATLVARQLADQRARHIDDLLRASGELDREWLEGTMLMSARADLTAAELRELSEEVHDFVAERLERFRARGPVEGSRVVAAHVNLFPVVGLDAEGDR